MITGFNHTSFTVADLDTAVRFWTEGLGFEAASVSERSGDWQERMTGAPGAKLRIAHLYGHGHHMELIQYLDSAGATVELHPNMACVAHVCFEVDDIDETARALAEHGATPQGEIVSVTSGPVSGLRACYLRDPCGVVIELVELVELPQAKRQ